MHDLVIMITIVPLPLVELILIEIRRKMMMKWSGNIFNLFKEKIKEKIFSVVSLTLQKTLP
jgi:hypothetical protein